MYSLLTVPTHSRRVGARVTPGGDNRATAAGFVRGSEPTVPTST